MGEADSLSDIDPREDEEPVEPAAYEAPAGRFITFEGGEGTGKSTQAGILANRLARAGHPVLATREPGGSPLGEEIRAALLSGQVWQLGPFAEAVLFAAARQEHVESAIRAALGEGQWVVCDRFINSTRAYQGGAGGVPRGAIHALERVTVGGVWPDLTFILDLPVEEGLARAAQRLGDGARTASKARPSRCTSACVRPFSRSPRKSRIDASSSMRGSRRRVIAEDIWEAVEARLGS